MSVRSRIEAATSATSAYTAPAGKILWRKGSHLLENIKEYYYGKKIIEETPPLISERTAFLCAVLFTILYVAPFYLSRTLRTSSITSRDAPSVIKARVRAVIFSCAISTIVAVFILIQYGHAGFYDVFRLFGIWPVNFLDCPKVLALVGILFMGPLYESIIVERGWRSFGFRSVKETLFDSWSGYRNYVVAPISEEYVFRSLVISLYLLTGASLDRIIFLTPMVFGVAHLHHLVEFVQARTPSGQSLPPGKVILIGIVRSLFQFAYTSLFGFFAAFVFLRTGSILAAITAHTFCNFMGLPRLWGKVGSSTHVPDLTPDLMSEKRDDNRDRVKVGNGHLRHPSQVNTKPPRDLSIGWSVVYYVLLVVGAFGFYKLLWSMTESIYMLAWFDHAIQW